jgi:hypothetical protein
VKPKPPPKPKPHPPKKPSSSHSSSWSWGGDSWGDDWGGDHSGGDQWGGETWQGNAWDGSTGYQTSQMAYTGDSGRSSGVIVGVVLSLTVVAVAAALVAKKVSVIHSIKCYVFQLVYNIKLTSLSSS